ncbi:TPA: FUSC family protein [Raoultella ornithinolytica]|nr:FUSC family protein [Raoultella ornithinolytica]HAT1671221.1 FUSC family protein [Raoultella ornithinolytica]
MLKNKINAYDLFLYKNNKQIHALRIAIGFAICFLIFREFNIQSHSWPLISLVVVLTPTSFVGNVLPRARHRIYGTLIGVLLGLMSMFIARVSFSLSVFYIFACFLFIGFLSSTKYQYVAILMGITLSVICSASPTNYQIALWRGADIIIGSSAAVLISLFFPQRAEVHWRAAYESIFMDIRSSIAYVFSKNVEKDRDKIKILLSRAKTKVELNQKIYTPLSKEMRVAVSEVKKIDNCVLEIIINIELVFNSIWINQKYNKSIDIVNALSEVNVYMLDFFRVIAIHIINPNDDLLKMSLFRLKDECEILQKRASESDLINQCDVPDVWLELNMFSLIESLESYILLMTSPKKISQ